VPLFAILVAQALACAAPTLSVRIQEALRKSKPLDSAFVGIEVTDLRTGTIVFQQNANHLFVPASNMKLFTTALALRRLGSSYRFQTTVIATQPPDPLGRVTGDIIWIGSGDPTLSGRNYPYHRKDTDEISLAPIGDLADQIVAAGVREVSGDIVGDDSRYPYEPHPTGWEFADELEGYGAPVSALIINDNRFLVQISPTEPGELADVITTGMPTSVIIDNRVNTVAKGKTEVQIERTKFGTLRLTGTITQRIGQITESVAMDDPAQSAAALLREALIHRGVNIHGAAIARHLPQAIQGPVLAHRTSPPLSEILQVMDKASQNLHAEVLLREVGFRRRNLGTREASLTELSAFLRELNIDQDEFAFSDGSGLARNSLVTPAAIVKLLTALYQSSDRELWMSLWPIGGLDGTLEHRFNKRPEAQRIQAKTGSISHVRALSGYALAKDDTPLAFSILVNNFAGDTRLISKFLDEAGLALLR
jgi:D-alanyl-D-alanine carboxypeptidase/D-alanyl-D-alanine-endopeptidase (penicillin-binding protein 4)